MSRLERSLINRRVSHRAKIDSRAIQTPDETEGKDTNNQNGAEGRE